MMRFEVVQKVMTEGRRYKLGLSKLTMCSGCKTVYYCGRSCQNADWNGSFRDDLEDEERSTKITHNDLGAPYGGCVKIERLHGKGRLDKGHKYVCKLYSKARQGGMLVGVQ
jgi:hypothetical protein